jgi:hypothetical protein
LSSALIYAASGYMSVSMMGTGPTGQFMGYAGRWRVPHSARIM